MSWSRLSHDHCSYNKQLLQATSSFAYVTDPNMHVRCPACRVPFGVVGGNEINPITSQIVDHESELRNQTRQLSNCPEKKYLPTGPYATWQAQPVPCETILAQYPKRVESTHHTIPSLYCPAQPPSQGPATYQPYFNAVDINYAPAE